MRHVAVFVTYMIFVKTLSAQCNKDTELHLLIKGRSIKDSLITVQELLKLDTVSSNCPWLKLNEITIGLDGLCINTNGNNTIVCPGNVICQDAKKYFEYLKPGAIFWIETHNATNKTGHKLPVRMLALKIVQEGKK
jgi:hypothetical protein